ncbi:MAG: DUF1427 family protein [Candidatus Competibacteraceae bacterium]|jgi:XapX domain-containing protein|nr:DUF1427 family protein [Candidatus Competibacteraceae bacterium]
MMDSIAEMVLGPITGILPGLGIGTTCRWMDIPLPAPPKLVGELLVVVMTLGFVVGVAPMTWQQVLLESQEAHNYAMQRMVKAKEPYHSRTTGLCK